MVQHAVYTIPTQTERHKNATLGMISDGCVVRSVTLHENKLPVHRNGDVLVIYAPNREALEMWLPRCGRKLCTFRCRNRCKLFQVSKHADSMLLDQSGHIEYLRQILGQAT